MAKKLTVEAMELIAERFRILSEPTRLRILHTLRNGELTVTELTRELKISQPNASKHLRTLLESGLLKRRQWGNSVFYAIADESIFELCEAVCDSLEEKYKKRARVFALA